MPSSETAPSPPDAAGAPSSDSGIGVLDALMSRRAVRAFLPTPVERPVIERILEIASRAPSGSNIQPWQVWVVAGAAKERLCAKILAAHDADDASHIDPYQYYPATWAEPYLSRRRKIGGDLYGLLGIAKGDKAAMHRQFGRNYTFFGAPVGLFLGLDDSLAVGSWFDLGTFLQSVLLAARGFGLHSCPQQAFSRYHRLIREELDIPSSVVIACGVAIGYEDPSAPENRLTTMREPVSSFARFHWD
ncbi:MAG: nitroreductase [Telmatospirillum sp.]|nr:nitroreductase [Telmatospirillum sp.]